MTETQELTVSALSSLGIDWRSGGSQMQGGSTQQGGSIQMQQDSGQQGGGATLRVIE